MNSAKIAALFVFLPTINRFVTAVGKKCQIVLTVFHTCMETYLATPNITNFVALSLLPGWAKTDLLTCLEFLNDYKTTAVKLMH